MERTVPQAASEAIDLYLRTFYSLLRTSTEVKIRSLEEVHAGMHSLLHHGARAEAIDMSAFVYSLLRLPAVIHQTKTIVLSQSRSLLHDHGLDVQEWQQVSAPARRRRCFYNGKNTLACLIASRSDIDDLVPILTAYQIEWNKLSRLLRVLPDDFSFEETREDAEKCKWLADALLMEEEDLRRLQTIWGDTFAQKMADIAANKCSLRVQLLNGSLAEYRKAMHGWWYSIEDAVAGLKQRPVYFISSNAHSLVNLLTGFALLHEQELVSFIEGSSDPILQEEWADIQTDSTPSSRENFFYYALKKYLSTPAGKALGEKRAALEKSLGMVRIKGDRSFDLEAQVIDLSKLDFANLDPRLRDLSGGLDKSDALIINIDYPLGMGAYHVFSEIAEHIHRVLGVYVMGKAATLNAVVGDVMIPTVVYDGQSRNTFLFSNCFSAQDVGQYLVHGTVLDSQKAVTVLGTFLQNYEYMDVFYREGYTDIEMEAGPYLSAIYELVRPRRYPTNEIVDLHQAPFDVGFLHYASDKPLSKGKNLGAASLSYYGMDPTYATSIAILRRIFKQESKRIKN